MISDLDYHKCMSVSRKNDACFKGSEFRKKLQLLLLKSNAENDVEDNTTKLDLVTKKKYLTNQIHCFLPRKTPNMKF